MLWRNLCVSACLAGLAVGCDTAPQEGPARGEALYAYCKQCHGDAAEGIEKYKTPAIAGLPAWYLEAQLAKFRGGARGDHPDDVDGLRMRPMSRTLGDDDLALVVEHIAALPPANPEPTLEGGDVARGKTIYATCFSCHGERGEGKREVNGPPIAGASDWYLLASLTKFRDGVRGADPQDTIGAQMRPAAIALADEQAMKDVVAYIMTLR